MHAILILAAAFVSLSVLFEALLLLMKYFRRESVDITKNVPGHNSGELRGSDSDRSNNDVINLHREIVELRGDVAEIKDTLKYLRSK